MSKRRGGGKKGGGGYRVGKNRPPPEHRWKPGQSGNTKGRPKGRKNSATITREILDRRLQVPVNGQMRMVTVRELMLTRFAETGLKGDTKSASFLLQRDDAADADATQKQDETTPEDREIIDAYLKSHLNKDTDHE
jgi:hypothetical protein